MQLALRHKQTETQTDRHGLHTFFIFCIQVIHIIHDLGTYRPVSRMSASHCFIVVYLVEHNDLILGMPLIGNETLASQGLLASTRFSDARLDITEQNIDNRMEGKTHK